MSNCVARTLVTAACLLWLAGCESANKTSELFRGPGTPETTASTPTRRRQPRRQRTPSSVRIRVGPETTGTSKPARVCRCPP